MKPLLVPALILSAVSALAAQPPLKIGLDTQGTEWIVSWKAAARCAIAPGNR
jgi:hypothetical protein